MSSDPLSTVEKGYNYLEFLPSELIEEILLYIPIIMIFDTSLLDIQSVFPTIRFIYSILRSKSFWIKKLEYDEFIDYILYLGISLTNYVIRKNYDNVYFNDYLYFYTMNQKYYINEILTNQKRRLWIPIDFDKINYSIKDKLVKLPKNESDIRNVLQEFENIFEFNNKNFVDRIIFRHNSGHFTYRIGYIDEPLNFLEKLTKNEMRIILTKLTLLGKDLSGFTYETIN